MDIRKTGDWAFNKCFKCILRNWLSKGVYQKKKTGSTGYRETFIEKKESWVCVIEILNYNFLRLKAFIENKKTWRWAFIVIVGAFIKNTNFIIFCLF